MSATPLWQFQMNGTMRSQWSSDRWHSSSCFRQPRQLVHWDCGHVGFLWSSEQFSACRCPSARGHATSRRTRLYCRAASTQVDRRTADERPRLSSATHASCRDSLRATPEPLHLAAHPVSPTSCPVNKSIVMQPVLTGAFTTAQQPDPYRRPSPASQFSHLVLPASPPQPSSSSTIFSSPIVQRPRPCLQRLFP